MARVREAAGQQPGNDLRRFLQALYGRARAPLLVELRVRGARGMTQRFVPVARLDRAEAIVLDRAPCTDVYVAVLPRRRQRGTRRDVAARADVLWSDCDGPDAVRALESFHAAPSLVVRSGTDANCHAYWLLDESVAAAEVERANRRLAVALGADVASADATRILRPPLSLNHKHASPRPVELELCDPDRVYALDTLVDALPEVAWVASAGGPRGTDHEADPLRRVEPAVYVERLTGQTVGRSRKVRCPLHDDHDPSLHVYADPQRGWYCFGCRRGGSVYDLAALLWNRSTRGTEFRAMRRDLMRLLS